MSQVETDISLTQIKIHTAFTISDGTNSSAFATTDAVYTPTTFAAKLTTDLGYTVTAGGDLTTTDTTPYYRLYLQFANAVTLTGMPKYIFNIPFSDFSVKKNGQVNFRNVNLDAQMTIATSYNTTSNTSTIPAGNYFINNFVSTIETDLVNYTLSYDEPNKRITFDSLAQDISMSITSTDTTVFDTSITEITTAANTLPFLTYGQPDPTIKNYSDNGITTSEFVSNGYTIPQLLTGSVIPDWNYETDANHFDQSYVKGFTDVSGSVVIRNDNRLITNGDLSLGGNLTGTTSLVIDDMTLKSQLLMGEDISANGKVYIGGDLSVNGQFSGDFANNSIPQSAIIFNPINISGKAIFKDDVSFNGPTVDVNIPPVITTTLIPDSDLTDTYNHNGTLYYQIPESPPATITGVSIDSLDQIEPISANMTGSAVGAPVGCQGIYKYEIDHDDNTVTGNWILGYYHANQNITKVCRIQFTLNGTDVTIHQISRAYNKNYLNNDTNSALGNGNYTSTAADLIKLLHDSTVNAPGFSNPIGSGPSTGLGYSITALTYRTTIPQIFQVNQIEFNDGTTMTTHDDNILSGTFADTNVVFKDSTFTAITCEGAATATTVTQSSDYRIKENVTELNEMDTVDALIPIQYNNTVSGNHEFGLLAHELQEIYPDLVNGEKDGDEYQEVHYNGLIGVLVKEVQDLKQRLAVLNNR